MQHIGQRNTFLYNFVWFYDWHLLRYLYKNLKLASNQILLRNQGIYLGQIRGPRTIWKSFLNKNELCECLHIYSLSKYCMHIFFFFFFCKGQKNVPFLHSIFLWSKRIIFVIANVNIMLNKKLLKLKAISDIPLTFFTGVMGYYWLSFHAQRVFSTSTTQAHANMFTQHYFTNHSSFWLEWKWLVLIFQSFFLPQRSLKHMLLSCWLSLR